MTWRYVGDKKGMQPIPGIPLEASDEVFDAVVERYESRSHDPHAKGSVKRSGLYEHVRDRRAAADADVEPEETEE